MRERSGQRKLDIPAAIEGNDGFWFGALMDDRDCGNLGREVERLFLARIRDAAPDKVGIFAEHGIARYHEVSHLIDHASVWGRLARRFDAEALKTFYHTSMFHRLRRIFGDFAITDEENVGEPLVRWRLVRPHSDSDIGPAHADSWFWGINGWPIEAGRKLVKVWSMLHGTRNTSGLMVLPGSHRRQYDFSAEIRDGSPKPSFDARCLDLTTLPIGPGQSVVFHYNLLHGGAVTTGDKTRVSFELTLAVHQSRLPHA